MADHPKESDPRGVNPTGQGPAQPRTNVPGGTTNTPQHLVGEGPDIRKDAAAVPRGHERKTQQTGQGTVDPSIDVADPHPADEGNPYREHRPGGANPPTRDLGPNPAIHSGEAARRSSNKRSLPD